MLALPVKLHHIGVAATALGECRARGRPTATNLAGEQALMARRQSKRSSATAPEALRAKLLDLMERNDTAETLNDNVVTPFVSALEAVCSARGYSLNIYGDCSNLVITTEEDAEAIYAMVETYLDEKAEADGETR